jgi:hypothetical protein
MSGNRDINRAEQFRRRHAQYGPTAVYQASASPDAILALLERKGEGPEITADPRMLAQFRQLVPTRHRSADSSTAIPL